MAWSKVQKPVCLVLLLLTNQLAGFAAPIPFRFAYFCHAFPVQKYPRNSPAQTWQFGVLGNKSLIRHFVSVVSLSIFLLVCILTRPTGSSKYDTTRKSTHQYYTTKRLIRIFIIWQAPRVDSMRWILCFDWLPERAKWSDTARPGLLVSFPQVKFRQSLSRCTKVVFRRNYFLLSYDFSIFMEPEKASSTMKTKKTKMLMSFKNMFCNKNRQTLNFLLKLIFEFEM